MKFFLLLISSLVISILSNDDIISLIAPENINMTNYVEIAEKQGVSLDCQGEDLGCIIMFNQLNTSSSKFLELSVKLEPFRLYDDINNGLGIWLLNEYDNSTKDKYTEFLGYVKKFNGKLIKITDTRSKIILAENNGEEIPKSSIYFDRNTNLSEYKARGIKFCNPVYVGGKINLRLLFIKNSLFVEVHNEKKAWKFCFSTSYSDKMKLAISSRMFKERFYYQVGNLTLHPLQIRSQSIPKSNPNSTSIPNSLPNTVSSSSPSHLEVIYKDKVTQKLMKIKQMMSADSNPGSHSMSHTNMVAGLGNFQEYNEKLSNMKTEMTKLHNLTSSDDNLHVLDQKEETAKVYEELRNATDELKVFIENVTTIKQSEDIKKIIISTIDNIIVSHKSINESIRILEGSISKNFAKVEKEVELVQKYEIWNYIIGILITYIFISIIMIFKKFSDSPVVKKRKIDHEKLFESIV